MASKYVGVCYGFDGDNLPPPQEVIALCHSDRNNIKKMRIYEPNQAVMQALGSSGIALILGVPNEDIEGIANTDNDLAAARIWVEENVKQYISNVSFTCIAVGNRVMPSDQAFRSVYPAMENINNALTSLQLEDKVKVSTAIDSRILGEFHLPSHARFHDDAINYIVPIIEFLVRTGAPLLANVHPYFARVNDPDRFSLDFALFNATDRDIIYDGDLAYKNLFDFLLDGIYCAVENLGFQKLGCQNLKIIVSASGWPSTGSTDANIDNGQIYYKNLISHVETGTPRMPHTIETYLFAMFNEKQAPNATCKSFGLFFPNKQPKHTGIFPL